MVIPPHFSFGGFPGGWKTTITRMLAERHRTLRVPRTTCRDRRLYKVGPPLKRGISLQFGPISQLVTLETEEISGTEYDFISPEEYKLWITQDRFLESHSLGDREGGFTGILRSKFWPQPDKNAELILSVFGSHAPEIKKKVRKVVPRFTTIFLRVMDTEVLLKRLYPRTKSGYLDERYRKIAQYKRDRIWEKFDHVIEITDWMTPEDCVKQVEEIAGLPSPSNRQLIYTP